MKFFFLFFFSCAWYKIDYSQSTVSFCLLFCLHSVIQQYLIIINMTGGAQLVLLVDGDCTMCCGCVKFIAERDVNDVVYFETQQSEAGKDLLKKYNMPEDLSTVVLLEKKAGKTEVSTSTKSTAILRTLSYMKGPWCYLSSFSVIPAFVRDGCYDVVAYTRYSVFGKQKECGLPSSDARRRIKRAVPNF